MFSLRKRFAQFWGLGEPAPAPEVRKEEPRAAETSPSGLEVTAGDVLIQPAEGEGWRLTKVLVVDSVEGYTPTAHVLLYENSSTEPTLDSFASSKPLAGHAPICAASYRTGWTRIGNTPVQKEELGGFYVYLKWTDFARYLRETGQSGDDVFAASEQHYLRANSLADEQKLVEALEEYDLAIDLCPVFIEAIDNRAFTYMELGDDRRALEDFEMSLRVEPDGVAAFFSKGECLMKLGELDRAEAIFREGLFRFWQKRDQFQRYLERTLALKASR